MTLGSFICTNKSTNTNAEKNPYFVILVWVSHIHEYEYEIHQNNIRKNVARIRIIAYGNVPRSRAESAIVCIDNNQKCIVLWISDYNTWI